MRRSKHTSSIVALFRGCVFGPHNSIVRKHVYRTVSVYSKQLITYIHVRDHVGHKCVPRTSKVVVASVPTPSLLILNPVDTQAVEKK
jgi:hypothetical protein